MTAIPTETARDINLHEAVNIGATAGAAERFDANLTAIRLLKKLDEEKRLATPEEQKVLVRYSGFGDSAFNQAFKGYDRDPVWRRRGEELKELLGDDEYYALEKSRINAFYTTPEIVRAMWDGLTRLGANNLSHPRVLEPSAGSGRFLGLQPTELAVKSQRTAVELDQMTGKILKNLYPDSEVYGGMGYEKAPIAKDSIDIAISNVPFGKVRIFDPEMGKGRQTVTSDQSQFYSYSPEAAKT